MERHDNYQSEEECATMGGSEAHPCIQFTLRISPSDSITEAIVTRARSTSSEMAAAMIRSAQHMKTRRAILATNFACEFCLRLSSALDGNEVLFMKEINDASLRNSRSLTQISLTFNTQNRGLAWRGGSSTANRHLRKYLVHGSQLYLHC
uniref:Uncharacterized protein n=1 Tax=Ascaris lumbricoides TaxID=6252 RepID=A0A0M3IWA1_ASCLU